MSNRSLDKGLIELLRSLMERIGRLEAQDNAVRKNDVRLGKMVVTTDHLYNRISIQNVKTKEQVFIGNPTDAVFSYSGTIEANSTSPVHITPSQTVAREIVISCRAANQGTADTDFIVHFDNDTTNVAVTLQADTNLVVRGVNIPLGKNQNIYVECTSTHSTDFPPSDISVFVRFGASATTSFTETDT